MTSVAREVLTRDTHHHQLFPSLCLVPVPVSLVSLCLLPRVADPLRERVNRVKREERGTVGEGVGLGCDRKALTRAERNRLEIKDV